jgi:hypothetical protein
MIRAFAAAAVATIAALGSTPPALAQKKSTGNLAAIQLECFKAQGAYFDAQTNRWMMQGTDHDMVGRTDAVNKCVAEKTGKPATQFMKQETHYK